MNCTVCIDQIFLCTIFTRIESAGATTIFQVPIPEVFAFKLLFAMILEVVNTYINIGKHFSSLCHTITAN